MSRLVTWKTQFALKCFLPKGGKGYMLMSDSQTLTASWLLFSHFSIFKEQELATICISLISQFAGHLASFKQARKRNVNVRVHIYTQLHACIFKVSKFPLTLYNWMLFLLPVSPRNLGGSCLLSWVRIQVSLNLETSWIHVLSLVAPISLM